jgi:flagellar hook protein FlgE
MISAYQSALSALKAYGTRIQSNANNVANADTDGFKKTRVILSEAAPQGVKADVEKINTPGPVAFTETGGEEGMVEMSNVDIGRELPEMALNSRMYEANLKTIQTVDEMTASLLKLKA